VLVVRHCLELAVEELLDAVGATEADSDDTLGLFVVDGAVRNVTPLLGPCVGWDDMLMLSSQPTLSLASPDRLK
jgi:hypothetical protein